MVYCDVNDGRLQRKLPQQYLYNTSADMYIGLQAQQLIQSDYDCSMLLA